MSTNTPCDFCKYYIEHNERCFTSEGMQCLLPRNHDVCISKTQIDRELAKHALTKQVELLKEMCINCPYHYTVEDRPQCSKHWTCVVNDKLPSLEKQLKEIK